MEFPFSTENHSGQPVPKGRERIRGHLEYFDHCQKSFHKLDAPQLLAEVVEGTLYSDGVRVKGTEQEIAA